MSDQKRVMVVDDQIEATDLLGDMCKRAGHEVYTLNDSRKFFDEFETFKPDAICLDILMPDLDGIEIVQGLSARQYRGQVIIISGGHPIFMKVAEGLSSAGNLSVQTLIKPFRLEDFRRILDEPPRQSTEEC